MTGKKKYKNLKFNGSTKSSKEEKVKQLVVVIHSYRVLRKKRLISSTASSRPSKYKNSVFTRFEMRKFAKR